MKKPRKLRRLRKICGRCNGTKVDPDPSKSIAPCGRCGGTGKEPKPGHPADLVAVAEKASKGGFKDGLKRIL